MWNLKYDTNEPIYKKKYSQTQRLVIAKGWGQGKAGLGVWD